MPEEAKPIAHKLVCKQGQTNSGVSVKANKAIMEKCIKVCAKDMSPFICFESTSFTELAQMLHTGGYSLTLLSLLCS